MRRHRAPVWMLGGEMIRRRHEDTDLRRQPVQTLLFNLIEEEGGSLIWPRITESEQRIVRCHLQEALQVSRQTQFTISYNLPTDSADEASIQNTQRDKARVKKLRRRIYLIG